MEELEASPGLAMALASDECCDDRPSPPQAEAEPPGLLLKQRREERGLTIEDLWRTTKINRTTLHAIEASDVVHLPAAIYTRGFVKAYAREVGLNPDITADDYLHRLELLRTPHVTPHDALHPAPADAPVHSDASNNARTLQAVNQARRFSRVAMLVAGAGLVLYLVSVGRQTEDRAANDAADYGGSVAPEAPDAARATLDRELSAAGAAEDANEPLRVELISQAPCWLSARVDGERVIAKLLQPGDRQTLDISDEAVLRVGEPGALSVSINGQSGRPLGRAGQPVTVRITRGNYRAFLIS